MVIKRSSVAGMITLLGVLVSLSTARSALGAANASDNAGNYSSWTNGSNGGTGFAAWNLTSNSGSSNDGYFLGDSTAGAGNVNTSGQSFGIYAHDSTFAVASRAFSGTLNAGQVFSIQLSANYTNGSKGVNLLNGSGTEVFNFNVGDGSLNGTSYSYSYKDSSGTTVPASGFSYHSDAIFSLSYTQTDASTGMVSITESSASAGSSVTVTDSFSTTNALASFQLYNSNTGSNASQNNLYFNNLSVVPEPSTVFGGLMMVGGGAFMFWRRRREMA